MDQMRFEDLGLIDPLLKAVQGEGYTEPTPIQVQAIPYLLSGRDLLGCAQTGTGKTAAFALPILQKLFLGNKARAAAHAAPDADAPVEAVAPVEVDMSPIPQGDNRRGSRRRRGGRDMGRGDRRNQDERGDMDGAGQDLVHDKNWRPIRALILTPTRELCAQIGESFGAYGRYTGLRYAEIYGGVSQVPQVKSLKRGVDVLVATPGRLLDLMGQRLIKFDQVEIFVLDEADRMLDMGFIDDVRKIIARIPGKRQTLLFSATLPREIQSLASSILDDPVEIRVTPETPAAQTVEHVVYLVEKKNKLPLLEHLLKTLHATRVLVFTATKRHADRVAMDLSSSGIRADAMHSDKTQSARQKALADFKSGRTRVLVASDIASRGLDIDDISHVINFDMPLEPESYIHRTGRTGRAGQQGIAISLCAIEERVALDSIERFMGKAINVVDEHPHRSPLPRSVKKEEPRNAHPSRVPVRRNSRLGRRRR